MDQYWANPYDTATWNLENSLTEQYLAGKDRVLDLGVGFYPHIESTATKHLVCVDISWRSLLVARKTYHKNNPRMKFICGDALNLPFPESTFDAVIAGGELINHLAGECLLGEVYRTLKPGGRAIISIGMKWCIDSIYAVFDALIGNRIGYTMTRSEAMDFVRLPKQSTKVTWEVTPNLNLCVDLYTHSHLKRMLSQTRFRTVHMESLNVVSGIIPLPLQQNSSSAVVKKVTSTLLALDIRLFSKIPGVRWFAGNIYLVLER